MEIVDKNMVSIVMLSRNSERFVEETLRSVMVQTYQNWNLIFIDDNSSDETIAVISRLKEEDRKAMNDDYKTSADRITIFRSA